jgi:branched-chain amino acid transport system ATP-binding protein
MSVTENRRPAEAVVGNDRPGADPERVLLAVNELTVLFGGVHAVDHVSFTVAAGSVTGLIGPNGAGKSTALKVVGGQLKPDSGTVSFDGHDITSGPAHRVARHGLVRTFQLGGEFARLTVMENLLVAVPRMRGASLWGALAGRRWWRESQAAEIDRAREVLASLDLLDKQDAYASDLSGGQRKLVEIARALMSRPRMLLLDEPMAGVNRSLARRIESTLSDLQSQGLTLLLVEHELGSVERLCDNVVVMAGGQVIAQGDMGGLRSRREVLDAYLGG